MGLDTLNEFLPKDTDPISLGDDAIRETRAATKVSFGLEHYLDGPHKIPANTTALRPAAGRQGRLFWNTDTHSMEYDNGSTWITYVGRKAAATILWHTSDVQVRNDTSGAPVEIPFDNVLSDPGGYANPTAHQIIMPPNSVCSVSVYLQWEGTCGGGYGLYPGIDQYDGTNWQRLVQDAQVEVRSAYYTHLQAIADSRWGTQLRVSVTNVTPAYMYIAATALGASPRFAMHVLGSST